MLIEANADPTVIPPLSTTPLEDRQVFTLEFKGNAGGYFRIWIVNIALSEEKFHP